MGVKKLKLNENMGEIVKAHGYELDAEERYVINIERELSEQSWQQYKALDYQR